MGLVTGALQFIVAGYALRLNRIFGTARVGWSLFWAFTLLALLHLLQSLMPFNNGAQLGVETEVMYSLISLLLLTGLAHIETLLKERLRIEQEEKRLRGELESLVKEKTAHLTRAIEDLQSEIAERKRIEAEVERTHKQLLVASRQAGMAEIANCVLQNVGKMLKSVNVSARLVSDRMKQSKSANVVRIGTLIREHEGDLVDFMAHDPRGQKLPVYIAQLAEYLTNEQNTLSTELESIKSNIEHIKEIVVMQQNCARLADPTTASNTAFLVKAATRKDGDAPGSRDGQIPGKCEPSVHEIGVETNGGNGR
jgi:C4-dicarboxylate-specific signal transduction histidine kinase